MLPLPARVDALRSCQQRLTYRGAVPLAGMGRLATQMVDASGAAEAVWQFGMDEQGRKTLQGEVTASVSMSCQRCLGPIRVPVRSEVSLALVWDDEQAAQLPRQLEPIVLESNELDLHELVEDELLLSVPLVPLHPEGECEQPESKIVQVAEDGVRKPNPFQVLAALKSGDPKP